MPKEIDSRILFLPLIRASQSIKASPSRVGGPPVLDQCRGSTLLKISRSPVDEARKAHESAVSVPGMFVAVVVGRLFRGTLEF